MGEFMGAPDCTGRARADDPTTTRIPWTEVLETRWLVLGRWRGRATIVAHAPTPTRRYACAGMPRAAVLSLLLAALLGAPAARAQSSSDRTAADVLFDEGRSALERGDVAGACSRFEASQRLEPAAGTLLNLGDCLEKLGRPREAWISFREALRLLAEGDDRRPYARGRIAALETRLARVVLGWAGAPPDGGRVTLNGEEIAPPYDVPRVVEPGRVQIVVRAAGRADRTIVGTAREGSEVKIALTAGEPVALATTERGSSARGTIATVALGAGGAALVAGGVLGVLALSASASATDRCGGLACADEASLAAARADASTAEGRATASTILLSAGGVAVAAGLVLLFTGGGQPRATATAAPLGSGR